MPLSAKTRNIIAAIRAACKEGGVRLILRKTPNVRLEGEVCSGYFQASARKIVISSKPSEAQFLAVLFHEFEHFRQWYDAEEDLRTVRAKLWLGNIVYPDIISEGHTKAERKQGYLTTLALERGAEIASTDALRRSGIGTEEERTQIMREAILYLYAHRLIWETNRWFGEGQTIQKWAKDPRVIALLPTKIRGTSFRVFPEGLRTILMETF